ncbi:MAG: hypothetical protein ACM3VV_05470 [Deltaproteobacteria bacterium]
MIVLEEVNAEEESATQTTIFKGSIYNIPTMINNTLLGKSEPISFNSTIQEADEDNYQDPQDSQLSLSAMINNALTSLDYVKEQFITIKQDEYNENMIFEETDKKVQVLTTKVPFILPIPFP